MRIKSETPGSGAEMLDGGEVGQHRAAAKEAAEEEELACALEGADATFATLGYVAGSQRALERVDWPAEVPCLVAVDDDEAGDKYAAGVRKALDGRVRVWRVRTPQGRDGEGRKRGDWSDLPDSDVMTAMADPARWEVCRG